MPSQQRQLLEIIEGYETFQEFDQRELDLIEPLRAMRVLYFNAWLARRWDDPAFPMAFPWFNTERYWSEYILELKELLSQLQLPPIAMPRI
jgi:Ser/Thr protein kinase RdoA (MazF antagonist)